MNEHIMQSINESIKTKEKLITIIPDIEQSVNIILNAIISKHLICICGNGGSASDAQHIAGELIGRISQYEQSLPVISLTTNTSILTAIGNDFSFTDVFSRQVEGIMKKNDVLIIISTSGNSENILAASKSAKKLGVKIIGLLGNDGGRTKKYCDTAIVVPSNNTQRIQECHILIGHIICELVKSKLG